MNRQIELQDLGWNSFFQNACENISPEEQAGRITTVHSDRFELMGMEGPLWGQLTGNYRKKIREDLEDAPVTGDWVLYHRPEHSEMVQIHRYLPRKTLYRRQEAGQRTRVQNLASNIDILCICTGLDGDFNLKRMDRYLMTAWESGIEPLLILSKADLCEDPELKVLEVENHCPGVEVLALSSHTKQGLDAFMNKLLPGKTLALVGSSGCGKSTLLNLLMGKEIQKTQDVREDDSRGRHTTTRRSLHILSSGALLIDTPGMREIQLWDSGSDQAYNPFRDIEDLEVQCRFGDCSHVHEPGCAVQEAIKNGELSAERLQEFLDFREEISMTKEKRRQKKQAWQKDIARHIREHRKIDKRS